MEDNAQPALRVMTLNCAHGARAPIPAVVVGKDAITRNVHAIAAAIDRVAPDVVALQEVDRGAFWSSRVDQVTLVAGGANIGHGAFGLHRDLPWLGLHHGTALLSRTAPEATRSHAFAASFLDDKGWVDVRIVPAAFGGRAVDVVSVHLDPIAPWGRRAQIETLARAFADRQRPLIVMGDVNAPWGKDGHGDAGRLASALELHAWRPTEPLDTYPSGRPWRRLDWILLSKELRFRSYATVPERVSDHRGVVADVVLADAAEAS
jgi:endonuclease/exonuclease/phosphatase family metal-dependent hydrolase